MGFTFYYTQMPSGTGRAILDAADRRLSFARQVELARVQIERQNLELQQAREANLVDQWEWKRRAEEEASAQSRQQFSAQMGQRDRALNLNERRFQEGVRQFDAQQKVVQDRLATDQQRALNQEYKMLLDAGGRPFEAAMFNGEKMVEYTDSKNRRWMMPREKVSQGQVSSWVSFAKNKLGRLHSELTTGANRRKELLESLKESEQLLTSLQGKLKAARPGRLRDRYEQQIADEEVAAERVRREIKGLGSADDLRREIDMWERQYQSWIGLLPPEVQQVLMQSEAGAGAEAARESAEAAAEDPEEYIRSFFGRRR